jgi:hypothetical protein
MKRQKICWRLISLLLAPAVLSLGQTSGVFVPGSPQQPSTANSPAPPSPMVRPGAINYIEGQVSLSGQELTPQSAGVAALNPGQTLDTREGYAEILLTPGAFLRVGYNGAIRLPAAGLADTRVELVHGSSILEVEQMIKGTTLSVLMNGATTRIEKSGLYYFDVAQQAVMVLDGKAAIQTADGIQTLGKHDQVLLASKHPLKKRNFNPKAVETQPLYVWSKVRSGDEAQASAGAAQNADAYAAAGTGWYWDPAWDFYGFWPAADALYSPFGWGFYSPAYFGFGYYGGGYYGGGYYGRRYWGHPGRYGGPGGRPGSGWHGGRHGTNGAAGGLGHSMGGARGGGGFHGGGGGFHGGGGGSHGGGGGHR